MVKFINLKLETDAKLKKFREFYKKQIITAHTLEFTVSDRNLKKKTSSIKPLSSVMS